MLLEADDIIRVKQHIRIVAAPGKAGNGIVAGKGKTASIHRDGLGGFRVVLFHVIILDSIVITKKATEVQRQFYS